jgi:hypothetical protein
MMIWRQTNNGVTGQWLGRFVRRSGLFGGPGRQAVSSAPNTPSPGPNLGPGLPRRQAGVKPTHF